jgi:hypothetical protein
MRRLIGTVLLFTAVNFAKDTRPHHDYVPDERTAVRIAEALLVSQFGQERVNAQLPLQADSIDKDNWLVQGLPHGPKEQGGNFGVWVDKHSGCAYVMERMK